MSDKKWVPIDISYQDVVERNHDLAIFACGYEKRSTFFASHIWEHCSSDKIVFGFSESKRNSIYKENYSFYTKKNITPTEISYKDTTSLVEVLISAIKNFSTQKTKHILIDYSSMPRSWFSEILNIIKTMAACDDFVVDLVYSVGAHDHYQESRQLGEPSVLPGCEAVSVSNKKTVAVFGLGFDRGAPPCLYDKVEPDETFGLVADPGGAQDYTDRALRENDFFIKHFLKKRVAHASLFSVQQCYSILREVLLPYQDDSAIVLIPFGPKPHALASILKAMNEPHAVCLYASTGISNKSVYATGDYVLTRLFLEGFTSGLN